MEKDDIEMSELEREFELDMDESEGEAGDKEYSEDSEIEEEIPSEDSEFELEFEEPEEESEGPLEGSSYSERFYEISQQEFESEFEYEVEIRRVIDDMEKEYFWNLKKLRRKAFKFAKNLPAFKALKGFTQLARGDLKGMLGSLAKAGLPMALSAIPGGSAALPALKALGFEASQDEDASRQSWNNFVDLSRESFEFLASNIDQRATDPLVASRLASNALQAGMKRVQVRRPHVRGKTFRVGVRKGERIKIIIEGI
jgi:hypothetical protein